jgi:hypothetical protein
MKHARGVLSVKLFPSLILFLISLFIVFVVPPVNIAVVLMVIGLVSLSLSLAVKALSTHKHAIISFLALFIFLSLRALNLFDPINVLLATSFLAGLFILIK